MIPKKAIKKFKNDIHREIAAGTLIAYGVFPRGNEGEKEAIKFIATRDEWLAPSDLPEYYDDINNDLYIGKENDAIRAIRKTLKQFYGIDVETETAGTETAVSTLVDDSVKVEEENNPDEKEVEAQAEAATEFITEAENTVEQQIDESVLDDFPPDIQAALAKVISKKTGVQLQVGEKKPSSSVTNAKIFKFLTTNLIKIQGQLAGIDKSIQDQTKLVQANLEVTASIYDSLDAQNSILSEKLGAILEAFNRQNELARQFAEDEKNRLAEERLEGQQDVAGTETAMSTLGKRGRGGGGNTLLKRLVRFFGRRLASRIFRALPFALKRKAARLRQLKRLPGKLKEAAVKKLLQRVAPKIAARVAGKATQAVASRAIGTGVVKGFEHIALPGITKAAQQGDKPVAKVLEKSGGNILQRALKSPVIQKALLRVLGKEGAEKLTVKLAAKLIPGVATAYGLGEGIARIAMGDVKGGFLSFGSAIPVAGYGFAAVDILRDINIDAYTRHIESNLPAPSNANIAAFFAEALGVTPDQYEMGGYNKTPGTKLLHGTEGIFDMSGSNSAGADPSNIVGGSLLSAVTQYTGMLGSSGAPIAGTIRQAAAPLAEQFDVPNTIVQTPVGGSFPSLQSTMKKVREKRKQTPEEELSGMEKDLLGEQDPESFADKLLKMLDPEGKFQELLKQINHRNPVGETGEGMAIFGESGIDKGTGYNAKGWVHGHFQNSNKQSLVSDTLEVVKKLINSGVSTVITATNKDLTKDMSEDELRRHIEAGVDGHKKYGSGVYAIDVSVPTGTKVPYELENVFDSKGPGGIVGTMKGRTTQVMHLAPGSKAGAAPGTTQVSPIAAPTGDYDVILPLDHVKPGNENKIPDKKGGNTFENARATGAAGRERQHQDKAAAKVKAKLEAKGLRVKIITPEDFGNYEDYDNYIRTQSTKGTRIVPLHFDAAVGQGGTGFLTRTRAGDSADAALAKPIQQALSSFQRANPSLGNLGPTDTVSNATINRASAAPAALVEMGSMVAWEKQHGSNFSGTAKFDELATKISEGIYKGGGFNTNMRPPTQRQPAQSKFYTRQGGDNKSDTQILMIPAPSNAGKAIQKNATIEGVRFSYNRDYNTFDTSEVSSTTRALLLQRLGIN
jgi:DNA-binding FrmR family transcriptional regulator